MRSPAIGNRRHTRQRWLITGCAAIVTVVVIAADISATTDHDLGELADRPRRPAVALLGQIGVAAEQLGGHGR